MNRERHDIYIDVRHVLPKLATVTPEVQQLVILRYLQGDKEPLSTLPSSVDLHMLEYLLNDLRTKYLRLVAGEKFDVYVTSIQFPLLKLTNWRHP